MKSMVGPCRYCDDGLTMFDEVAVQCPECGWHECSTPPLIHHSEHVCPECENRW